MALPSAAFYKHTVYDDIVHSMYLCSLHNILLKNARKTSSSCRQFHSSFLTNSDPICCWHYTSFHLQQQHQYHFLLWLPCWILLEGDISWNFLFSTCGNNLHYLTFESMYFYANYFLLVTFCSWKKWKAIFYALEYG